MFEWWGCLRILQLRWVEWQKIRLIKKKTKPKREEHNYKLRIRRLEFFQKNWQPSLTSLIMWFLSFSPDIITYPLFLNDSVDSILVVLLNPHCFSSCCTSSSYSIICWNTQMHLSLRQLVAVFPTCLGTILSMQNTKQSN